MQIRFDLVTPAGIIGEETQRYRFSGDERSRFIDCAFAIHATRGPITMRDTKEGTFAIRVAKGLHPPLGQMVNADGASGEKGLWGKRSNWVDYSGRVGGKDVGNDVGKDVGEDVGIAVFDHPQNRRTPAYWHARAYGLLAANPFGLRQFTGDRRQDGRYTIPAGESLVLRLFTGFSVFCRSGFVLVADGDVVPFSVGGDFALFAGAWPCLRFRFLVT